MNLKNFPGPTNNELIFLEFSTFSSAAVPKILSSLEYQKKLSVQSQLRFIPKLHNQGYTCSVLYQILIPTVLRRLRLVCAGICYAVIHPGTLWDTMFGFWIMHQLYCHMEKHCAKFHLTLSQSGGGGGGALCPPPPPPGTLPLISQERLELPTWNFLTIIMNLNELIFKTHFIFQPPPPPLGYHSNVQSWHMFLKNTFRQFSC